MQAAAINPTPSPVEAEVLRIRELLERSQFAAALGAAEAWPAPCRRTATSCT